MAKGTKRRSDGRIARQIYLGLGDDGKRKYKTVYGATNKEADEKAEEIRLLLHKGANIGDGDRLFAFWADCFLKNKEKDCSAVYYAGVRSRVQFWKDAVGAMPIRQIRITDLQKHLDALAAHNPHTKKPTARKTLRDYVITASGIFDFAVMNQCVTFNPANYLKVAKSAPKHERRALTPEEQRWIRDTPHRAQTAAMLMMYAGLRRGELLALQIRDIDLSARTVTINKSIEMVGGHPLIKAGGKTKAASRVVSIPTILVQYLESVLSDAAPFDLVCPGPTGKFMSESNFRQMWDSYLIDLNVKYGQPSGESRSKFDPRGIPMTIPHITPHWLRHTFATMLYLSGVDVLTARDQLGHTDIQTTLSVYTHLDSVYKRRSMDKLDAYLQEQV